MNDSTPFLSRASPKARSLNLASKFFCHRPGGSRMWPSASLLLPICITVPSFDVVGSVLQPLGTEDKRNGMNFFLLRPSKITEERDSPSFSLRTPPVFLFLSPPFLAHGRRALCSSAISSPSESGEC